MPRRGGGGRRRTATKPRAPPRRPAPPASRSRPAPSSRQAKSNTNNAQQQKPGQPAGAAAPSGGMAGGMLGTLGASMAGSMMGHAMYDNFFGGKSEGGEAGAAGIEGQEQSMNEQIQQNPCAQPFQNLMQCLDQNSTDIGSCQWINNMFTECKHDPNNFATKYQ
eukprot:CAMPEP_0168523622 /NCGR_PEP_ID=MMETSP0405-20121227/10104_1 /TAXON_ID=498012 /ORGANISM="Trichosphaerium sp, Strain Am-I-7 wt" /LENGTH=163 /DNA_ID=CAMNT_0008545553 /DNA_START=18 /DNA_END=509 /DNA_ORIENTATION=+